MPGIPQDPKKYEELRQEGAQERAVAQQTSEDEQSRLLAEETDLLFNEDRRLETIRKLKEEKEESERKLRRPPSD
jgi:hypothetical protein